MVVVEYSPYIVIPIYVALFALGIFLILRLARNKTRKVSTLRNVTSKSVTHSLKWTARIGMCSAACQ